jgi:esterase/lipase superfamily enzyme
MIKKLLAFLLIAAVGTTLYFILHHPPMRLMPPPLAIQMGGERVFDVAPDLAAGNRIDIFYGTSRLPVGPSDNRVYTVAPDRVLRLGTATLRIGEESSTLDQIREWTIRADTGDRPFLHLESMREAATLPAGAAPDEAAAAWFAQIDAALAESRSRDVLVYVHGANTTVERAAGQASQLRHYSGHDAVVVLFAWPTAENFLRYGRDIETAFASAPHLGELIAGLLDNTSAERVNVFTYSAGGTVGSHGLALLAAENPVAASRVGEVYHAAPDADFRDFVTDLKVYAPLVGRVTTALNLGDSALRLAEVVNRGSRAGRPDLSELNDEQSAWILGAAQEDGLEVLQIRPENMPDLPATSHTFWYDDPWVSNDVMLTMMLHLAAERRGLDPGVSPSGARYWTFPPDYPERVRAALAAVARR